MAVTMYHASVLGFQEQLADLKHVIEEVEAHVNQAKWDENTLLGWRLHPDMPSFADQVRRASETALGARLVAGLEVPSLPAFNTSFAEMKAGIEKTIEFLKMVEPEQLEGKEKEQIRTLVGGEPDALDAQSYLFGVAVPDFYYHVATAYNILRHLGMLRRLPGKPPSRPLPGTLPRPPRSIPRPPNSSSA